MYTTRHKTASAEKVLPAIRELFSRRPTAVGHGPETIGRMLCVRNFLPYRPDTCEVEAALEALVLEGEVAA